MITDSERNLIEQVFTQGASALLDSGYNEDTARAFLLRPDVAAHWRVLNNELGHQEILSARSTFLAKREAGRFRAGAIAVLGRGLAGPSYLRDADGAIRNDAKGNPLVSNPGPTAVQIHSAESLLEVIGALGGGRGKLEGRVEDYNPVTALVPVNTETLGIEEDSTLTSTAQRALSREKVRNAMLLLAHLVPQAKKTLDLALKGQKPRVLPKKKVKPATDNTVSSEPA